MNEYNVWELFSLRNRVALVTGGASGLGYDMALALAEAGADIAITSRHLAKAQRSAEKIARENAPFRGTASQGVEIYRGRQGDRFISLCQVRGSQMHDPQ